MVLVAGLDEAGRGPIIGPMVIAGVVIEENDFNRLISIGVKDSKLLSQKQREKLFAKIIKIAINYKIIIIEPKEIDAALKSMHLNLNKLEAMKFAEIINVLNPNKAIIDCPSNNILIYKNYIGKFIKNKDIELIIEHKADLNYVVVSAASVLAKVIREKEMEKIKKLYGDCGPGYMSNPITQKFLELNWDRYPHIFRKSWIPYKSLEEEKSQTRLKDFLK